MSEGAEQGGRAVCRLRARFSRDGLAAKLSQLEQIKALRRIAQDSGLPVAFSAGKHSAVKMSFGPAIAVGYLSEAEYADIYLSAPVQAQAGLESLAGASSGGYRALEARRVPVSFPSVEALVNVVEYSVMGDFFNPARSLESFLAQDAIVLEKVKPSGARETIDARPLIREMSLEQDGSLRLVLRFGPKKNLKPELIAQAWLERPVCAAPAGFSIIRKRLFWEDGAGNLNAP